MKTIQDILEAFAESVKGICSTGIVSIHEGTAIASVNFVDQADTDLADAFFSKAFDNMKILQGLLGEDGAPDALVASSEQLNFLLAPIIGSGYFWWVTTVSRTNTAFTRAIMRKYTGRIAGVLP